MAFINLTVNGIAYEVSVKNTTNLLEVLRDSLHITSPKAGCETGDCGSCSVMIDGKLKRACTTNALMISGSDVVTLEGLSSNGSLHPLQQQFHENYGYQCGFCTPGMILASKALLDENPNPTEEEIKDGLSGNLCRCTGYVQIIDSVMAAAKVMQSQKDGE